MTNENRPTTTSVNRNTRIDALLIIVLIAAAGALLLWRLDRRYLWQDEAATAVLAERMLEYGKPLAYDSRNLITWEVTTPDDADGLDDRVRDPEAMIQYHVARGDFKDDTTWIRHPWGQFVLAAASLGTLGHGTWQARVPFALCGVMTVVVLYAFVRAQFNDRLMAFVASVLLLAHVYWVLHMRQCRYYAPSSLFLLLAMLTYARWQNAQRFGAAIFVTTGWFWFQFDYGTFWPVMGVFAIDSVARRRRPARSSLATFVALAAAVTPWVFYYELFDRPYERTFAWQVKQWTLLFKFNQFIAPVIVLVGVAWLVYRDSRSLREGQRQLLVLCFAILTSLLLWVPLVATAAHHRYIVLAAPLACVLLAYGAVRGAGWLAPSRTGRFGQSLAALALAAAVVVSPVFSIVFVPLIPASYREVNALGTFLRAEWRSLYLDLGGSVRDPNRELIAFLRPRLDPEDEVLVVYKDIPLMFYLPNRIRGGMALFRLRDATPPRVFVGKVRTPLHEFQWEAVQRYLDTQKWRPLDHDIPEFFVTNCPDPSLHFVRYLDERQLLLIAEPHAP